MAIPDQLLLDILREDSLITSDGILDFCRQSPRLIYAKRDFVFRKGTWRGQDQRALILAPELRGHSVAIGHSDFHLTKAQSRLLKARGIRHIFATNCDPIPGYVTALPLGLTNDCDDSEIHRLFGNRDHLRVAWKAQPRRDEYTGTVFANFNVSTASAIRRPLLDWCRQQEFVRIADPDVSDEGRISYLADLRRANFTICPQGNGVDTHRCWETLYMGGYPVMKRHPGLEAACEDLPVVWVNDWTELADESFRAQEWMRLQHTEHDGARLNLRYWTDRMQRALGA